MIKVCENCVGDYEPTVGKRQRFCSDDCSRAWWASHKEARKRYTYTCHNCGKEYRAKSKDRDQFCSRECAFAFKTATKEQREQDEAQGIGSFCAVYFPQCIECGDVFTAQRDGCLVCSRQCSLARGRRLWREYKEALGRNAGRIETVVCQQCGKTFKQKVYNQVKRYCSSQCARKAWAIANPKKKARMRKRHHQTRRARKYGNGAVDHIDSIHVFERDNWTCGICGRKVDKGLVCPHPGSPSLDHIIPLAAGGTHTLGNVQLAHFMCNSIKGASGGGQLRLGFGLSI